MAGSWQGRGRGTAGERLGNGMVCVNRPFTRQGTDRERHGMCDLGFKEWLTFYTSSLVRLRQLLYVLCCHDASNVS
jgi:hypothetical protein